MASTVHCRLDCDSPVFPGSYALSIIQISWDAPAFSPLPKDPPSVSLLRCSAVCIGWVRSSAKNCFRGEHQALSPYLTSRYKQQAESGQLKQIFCSDPVVVCSNVSDAQTRSSSVVPRLISTSLLVHAGNPAPGRVAQLLRRVYDPGIAAAIVQGRFFRRSLRHDC